jgi:transposase-like protein
LTHGYRDATITLVRPYSEDLRKMIVAAVEHGMAKTEAARTFGVSLSSVRRFTCAQRIHDSLGRPIRQLADLLL